MFFRGFSPNLIPLRYLSTLMKKLLPLLMVLWACAANAQLEEPSLFPPSRMQMNHVKGILATQYLITITPEGKAKGDSVIGREQYTLNAMGLVTQQKTLPGFRQLDNLLATQYDSLGRKIHQIDDVLDAQGKRLTRTIRIWSYQEGMKPSIEYRYLANDSGKAIPQKRIVFDYDDQGKKIAAHHILGVKEEINREIVTYPTPDRELHRWIKGVDTLFDHSVLYADEMGRLVRKSALSRESEEKPKTDLIETVWKYDDLGLLREKEIQRGYAEGEVRLLTKMRLITYQYDEDGLLKEEIIWDFPQGAKDYVPTSVTRFEYQTN
jgi:hypothetical protein